MIALVLILVAAVAVLAFISGMALQRRLQVDYKKRWQESLAVIDGRELSEVIEPKPSKPKTAKPALSAQILGAQISMQQLHRLPSWSREELERQRAQAGLPQRDDLQGLPSWSVEEIMSLRTRG